MVQEFSQLLSPFSVEYSKSSIDFCFWVIPISEKVGVEEEGIAELEKSTEAGRRIRVLNGWNLKLVTLPKSITIIVKITLLPPDRESTYLRLNFAHKFPGNLSS